MKSDKKVYSVRELNVYIERIFEEVFPPYIYVKGEITDLNKSSTGHIYFTLSDKKSQIRCIIWKYKSNILSKDIKVGSEVLIRGKVNLYVKGGNYSLIVEEIEFYGKGLKQLKILKLKKKLKKQGYFDKKRKKELPFLPKNIGVITSKTGAAFKDILKVLRRRNQNINIILSSVTVQGENASKEIAKAIRKQNEKDIVDVLIVGRGGGSKDDLYAFDTEEVAMAIATSNIPVITAIGHQIDYSISDLIADKRAETPSAAAELVMKKHQILNQNILDKLKLIRKYLYEKILDKKNKKNNLEKRLKKKAPQKVISDINIEIDENLKKIQKYINVKINDDKKNFEFLYERLLKISKNFLNVKKEKIQYLEKKLMYLNNYDRIKNLKRQLKNRVIDMKKSIEYNIKNKNQKLDMKILALNENNPLKFLKRGYTLLQKNKRVVSSVNDIKKDDKIKNILKDGEVESKVVDIEYKDIKELK